MNNRQEQIETARQLIATGINEDLVAVLHQHFPELKESEDERIRKWIYNIVENLGYPADEDAEKELEEMQPIALAWLEKQKEQKKVIADRELTDFEIEVHEIIAQARSDKRLNDADTLKEFEQEAACALMMKARKELEQKPAEWSEDGERKLNRIYEILGHAADDKGFLTSKRIIGDNEAIELQDFLKSLRPQPKQEWSEEDENKLRQVMELLLADKTIALRENPHCKALHRAYEELLDWLKSLRPQPRRKDTYYDIIHNILDTIKDMDFMSITPEHRVSLLNDIRVKCKNADECAAILDEPHWKPSEEQIVALRLSAEEAFDDAGDCNRYRRLKSLYDDLQKLL